MLQFLQLGKHPRFRGETVSLSRSKTPRFCLPPLHWFATDPLKPGKASHDILTALKTLAPLSNDHLFAKTISYRHPCLQQEVSYC